MSSLILIVCFSVVVILLLTVLLIRSSQDSEKREARIVAMMEAATAQSSTHIQTLSTELPKAITEAIASTNDTMTKVIESTNKTTTDLFLGREREISEYLERASEEPEKQPIPGIETFAGLPKNMVDALQREDRESQVRLTAPQWTVVSAPQPNESVPNFASQWILDDDPMQ